MSHLYVLVHAPLVGPSTWRWVAEALGDAVVVPKLHRATDRAGFETYVDCIADVIPRGADVTLVGHSGSGVLLPFAAARADAARVAYVFVDAGLPPLKGSTLDEHPALEAAGIEWTGRPSFADRVEADGYLPRWDTWWGDDGMTWLVPNEDRRAAISADMPRLALAFYDEGGTLPPDWASAPAGYVLLSETYRIWADVAHSYGWPVEEVLGTHLELVNRPHEVAAAVARVAEAARAAAPGSPTSN
jgi:hypothetical protein